LEGAVDAAQHGVQRTFDSASFDQRQSSVDRRNGLFQSSLKCSSISVK